MSDRNGLKRSTQGGGGQPLEQDSTVSLHENVIVQPFVSKAIFRFRITGSFITDGPIFVILKHVRILSLVFREVSHIPLDVVPAALLDLRTLTGSEVSKSRLVHLQCPDLPRFSV